MKRQGVLPRQRASTAPLPGYGLLLWQQLGRGELLRWQQLVPCRRAGAARRPGAGLKMLIGKLSLLRCRRALNLSARRHPLGDATVLPFICKGTSA